MKRKKELLVVLFFIGLAGLFFYPVFLKGWLPFPGDLLVGNYAPWNSESFLGYAPGGVPHKAQGIDVVRQFFPWKNFSVETFKKREIPFWNPYFLSGNPHMANFQTGIFYPLNIIFLFLPFNLAWTIFIICQPILACLFAYLFLREIKTGRFGSLLAAISFAYCLFSTVWIEYGNIGHTILWFPLILFFTEKIINKLEKKWVLFFILSLVFSILAGFVQLVIYLFGVVILYFLFRLWQKKTTRPILKLFTFLTSIFFALGLSAVQILPTIEIFLRSARQAYPPEKIPELLLPWFYPVTIFASDFFGNPASRNYWYPGTYIERVSYIGVLPLFFAFLAIINLRKEKKVVFFSLMALGALIFSLNLAPIRYFYGLKIPVISTTVYTRLLSVFSFSMAILAGFGLDFYWRKSPKKRIVWASLVFFGFYLFLWLFVIVAVKIWPQAWWRVHLAVTRRNLILPTLLSFSGLVLFFLAYHWSIIKKLIVWGFIGLTIFDLYFYFNKITPFSPSAFVYPPTKIIQFLSQKAGIDRFWGYGIGYIDSNFSTHAHTYGTEGWEALFIRRYGELISASDNGKIKKPIPRSDVVLTTGFGQDALRENPYRQRLLNLLGVKYLLQKNEGLSENWQSDYQTFPESIYQLIWQKDKWQVYENKSALPRIFLAGDYLVENDEQKIVDLIMEPTFDLRKKLILEEKLPENYLLDKQTEGEVKLLSYQPNKIEIETRSSGNKILFISDNYFSGWQAKIDGKGTKIFRADYAFRAVVVPVGCHKIVFSYLPSWWRLGLGLTLFSLICIIILAWQKNRILGLG